MKFRILILFTLIVLTIVSCQFDEKGIKGKNENHKVKIEQSLQRKINKMPIFDYSSKINGHYKFIRFFQDSVVWGLDSLSFTSYYQTCREMDDLQPREWSAGYDVKFLNNFIVVGHFDDNIFGDDNLFNRGISKMFFSLNSNYYYSVGRIYSIDYRREYLLLNSYEFEGKIDPEFPLAISKFPSEKTERKYQIVELPFKNNEPNKITRANWNDDELVIRFREKPYVEKEKTIKIKK